MDPLLGEASGPGKLSGEQLVTLTRTLHLDNIPENALDNIMRFFSRSPRAENCLNHTSLVRIYGLYDVQGELGRFLLVRFTGVDVIRGYFEPMDLDRTRLANEDIIVCTSEFLLKLSLSGRVITYFQTIVVGDSLFREVVIPKTSIFF